MLRRSLALYKAFSQPSFLTTSRLQTICIEQPKPTPHYEYLQTNEEYKAPSFSTNIFRDILQNKQEIYIDGPATPIMECKHKPKELAKRKRRRRRNGGKISARWK